MSEKLLSIYVTICFYGMVIALPATLALGAKTKTDRIMIAVMVIIAMVAAVAFHGGFPVII